MLDGIRVASTVVGMTADTEPATSAYALRVGREIHAELIRQGLTQEQLAEKVGTSQQWVSRRITGRTPADMADVERIAAALGVPISQLLPVEPAGDRP